MGKMKWYDWTAFSLVTIGAINWGLSLFGINLVTKIFTTMLYQQIIYGAVGIAGVYGIYAIFKK